MEWTHGLRRAYLWRGNLVEVFHQFFRWKDAVFYLNIWLVGGLKHFYTFFIFHNIWDNPSHWRTHIFQRGRYTTNQILIIIHHIYWLLIILFHEYPIHYPIDKYEVITLTIRMFQMSKRNITSFHQKQSAASRVQNHQGPSSNQLRLGASDSFESLPWKMSLKMSRL